MRLSVLAAVLLAFTAGWTTRFLTQDTEVECVRRWEVRALQQKADALEVLQLRNTARMVQIYDSALELEVRRARWASTLCE